MFQSDGRCQDDWGGDQHELWLEESRAEDGGQLLTRLLFSYTVFRGKVQQRLEMENVTLTAYTVIYCIYFI